MKRFGLLGILLLAFLLRVLWLDKFPVGFTPDEASLGYDAYSILKTGKDQWGRSFPLVLESFGDFKSPLYAYLTIPFVAIFGLTKVAVRLPNALLGTAAIYVTYLLARELSQKEKLGLIASLLLAISPWHVMISRGAFEANLTTFFLPLGVYLFLKGLRDSRFLVLSSFIFGLNLFTYHSAKFVTPVVFLFMAFLFRHELGKIEKKYFYTSLVLFLTLLAFTISTFFQGAGARAADISILKTSLGPASEERIVAVKSGWPDPLARLIHNKYQVAGRQFLGNYLSYFSPQFLFSSGPAETTYGMLPGRGVLYWFESVFLAGFIFYVAKEKLSKPLKLVILWFFISPIPASLAIGPGYAANRVTVMVPVIQIISGIGAVYLIKVFKDLFTYILFKVSSVISCLIGLILFLSFLESYLIQSPHKAASGMLYGNLEAAQWLTSIGTDRQIIISRGLSEPHIYVAFANSWDPNDYQRFTKTWDYKGSGLTWVDQIPEYKLGNYIFKNIDWRLDNKGGRYLVGKPEEFPEDVVPLKIFYYPNGGKAILIVDPATQKLALR